MLQDLHLLPDRVWLVIDDLHELRSPHALRQLELLVMRAPADLRFVFASRRAPAGSAAAGRLRWAARPLAGHRP